VQEYLRCGDPDYGCVLVVCRNCGDSQVVAFSCKRRGFCPSCCGRRMNDAALHLTDRVIPEVVENWNSGNGIIFYGKDSELVGPDREHTEVSMLALHLLQSALVHINTLLLQNVLERPAFAASMGPDERRALSPLFWTHINPYGRFQLDMDVRLDFTATA
jgi:hypothetical protein